MNSTSPPASVQARPVATPGRDSRNGDVVLEARRAQILGYLFGVDPEGRLERDATCTGSPAAARVASTGASGSSRGARSAAPEGGSPRCLAACGTRFLDVGLRRGRRRLLSLGLGRRRRRRPRRVPRHAIRRGCEQMQTCGCRSGGRASRHVRCSRRLARGVDTGDPCRDLAGKRADLTLDDCERQPRACIRR